MNSLKELPEKTRKLIVLIVSITFVALVALALYGANLAKGPTPEMIIAPAPSVNTQV